MTTEAATNSLGLDLENLKIDEQKKDVTPSPAADATAAEPLATEPPQTDKPANADESREGAKEKTRPYVNPERVKTGGAPRDKLTDEELAERMARIREQNEKIKQRRIDVQADEEAFKRTQAAERVKQAKARKIQETVDRTREQNAKRKMDKMQNREWDSGKKQNDWARPKPEATQSSADKAVSPSQAAVSMSASPPEPVGETTESSGLPERGAKQGERGRGRGRGSGGHWRGGRGRGGGQGPSPANGKADGSAEAEVPPETSSEAAT